MAEAWGAGGVRPPRFWQNRRHCRAAAVRRINTCFLDPAAKTILVICLLKFDHLVRSQELVISLKANYFLPRCMGCENKKKQHMGLGAPLLSKYSYKVKDENSKNMDSIVCSIIISRYVY